MAQVFGYTTLQVIPSMRGAVGALESDLSGLGAVGRSAGRDIGKGVAKGITDSKADVERASAVAKAASDRQADPPGQAPRRAITQPGQVGGRYAEPPPQGQ
ncbi:hypothetical protein, partial [Nocardia wallacei]|uniref:hypothetical protein n=1 Tax=Nocardia wallacei TaxID=480035 RepID=UPI0024564988